MALTKTRLLKHGFPVHGSGRHSGGFGLSAVVRKSKWTSPVDVFPIASCGFA